MIWKKLRKAIIPFIIVKVIILVFVIFGNDIITISRDINYSSNYKKEIDSDSTVVKRQKLIRIVRNEEDRGISIKLRGRKNARPLRENEDKDLIPLVD